MLRSIVQRLVLVLVIILLCRYKNWISVMEPVSGTRHPDLERGAVILVIAFLIWLAGTSVWTALKPLTKSEWIPEVFVMIGGGWLFGPGIFWLFNVLLPGVLISDHLSTVKMGILGIGFLAATWKIE